MKRGPMARRILLLLGLIWPERRHGKKTYI